MMPGRGKPVKVYVAMRPMDFRKGIDGLALAVQEMFGLDPYCGAVFVFRSKRVDRIKLLVCDQTGMVLVQKRLEGGKFVWPACKVPHRGSHALALHLVSRLQRWQRPATYGRNRQLHRAQARGHFRQMRTSTGVDVLAQ